MKNFFKKLARFFINYLKLFLMPFIFVFMLGTLLIKASLKLFNKIKN